MHWDYFFNPLSKILAALPGANTTLRYMRERLKSDDIHVGIMQGEQKIKLFDERTPGRYL